AGTLEFAGALTAPDGSIGGQASVRRVGTGRVVTIDSDQLPVLPAGELYEVWFVGPGDAPGTPNRISAGTFHPDSDGRSAVRLTAAVDPARYPQMVITAEPGGGDPAPNGPEVLRAAVADGP
ncbi:MAG TPA: anti-sigma factor, partial [Acidimicrobiales bacterium]